jgi:hypothetical protein
VRLIVGRYVRATVGVIGLAAVMLLGTPLLAREAESKQPDAPMVSSPEDLLRRYTEAMRAGDFEASAAFMHPEALAHFQRIMAEVASIDTTGQVASQLFGLPAGQTVSSMKPTAAFARMMQMLTTAVPGMSEALKSSTAKSLGSIKEGELVHVVYRSRMEFGGNPVEKVEVLSAKRDGTNWRALLRGDMENMLKGIIQRVKSTQGA